MPRPEQRLTATAHQKTGKVPAGSTWSHPNTNTKRPSRHSVHVHETLRPPSPYHQQLLPSARSARHPPSPSQAAPAQPLLSPKSAVSAFRKTRPFVTLTSTASASRKQVFLTGTNNQKLPKGARSVPVHA